jgi:ankyrin repeat protein
MNHIDNQLKEANMCYVAYTPDHPYSLLAKAAANGDVNHIRNYLSEHQDFDINLPFAYGDTLLNLAVKNHQYNEAELLINEYHADAHYSVGSPNLSTYTPSAIQIATEMHDAKMLDMLHGPPQESGIIGSIANALHYVLDFVH